jgi:hypothetical protein
MKVIIGKIVKSSSHINYICQIYGPMEIEVPPAAAAYAFGRFVRIAVHSRLSDLSRKRQERDQSLDEESPCYTVGVIYDTQLLNPTFGSLGPRLSTETQVELFSSDHAWDDGASQVFKWSPQDPHRPWHPIVPFGVEQQCGDHDR